MRKAGLSLVSLVCLFGIITPLFRVGAAAVQVRPLNPTLIQELTPNIEPNSTFFTCTDGAYLGVNPNKLQPQNGCIYHSSFGDWVLKNTTLPIYIGPRGGFRINTTFQFFPNKANGSVIGTYFSSSMGTNVLSKFTVSDNDLNLLGSWSPSGTAWEYSFKGTHQVQALKYPNSTQIMTSYYQTLGFSENGKWMAVRVMGSQGYGVALIDSATFTPKVISWDPAFVAKFLYNSDYTHGDNVAVSNDGRFVASAGWVNDKPQLRVYDTSTCSDQSANFGSAIKNCTYGDVWNGTYPSGMGATGSFVKTFATSEAPRKIAFTSDNKIVFESIHDRTSSTMFKVAQYSVANVMSEASIQETMLALGDSYISGEGAYSYISGTDTSDNKCHQSSVSYPYLLGAQLFGQGNYHSVACSGAVTDDIVNSDSTYENQLQHGLAASNYSDEQKKGYLTSHLPGYINQLRFVDNSKPNAILLSIGGNDAHFADIVTACVLSPVDEPCFDSQSERSALMNMVHDLHTTLRSTYRKILDASPGVRLYVMGYPQVASTTGLCAPYVHLDAKERVFAKYFIDEINATVQNAAEAEGAYFVDVSTAFQGHRLCDTNDDAVNGLTRGDDKAITFSSYTFGLGNESYHPTVVGHAILADAIADQTYNLTASPSGPTGAGVLPFSRNKLITTAEPDNNSIFKSLFLTITSPLAVPGKIMQVEFDTKNLGISPGKAFRIVFHSQEVQVASGVVSPDGIIRATFTPPHVSYGGHMIHLYIQDDSGQGLDIMQNTYIIANEADCDGDGILNAEDPMPYINETGVIVGGLFEQQNTPAKEQQQKIDDSITGYVDAAIVTTSRERVVPGTVQTISAINDETPLQAIISPKNRTGTFMDSEKSKNSKPNHLETLTGILLGIGVLIGAIVYIVKHKRSHE